MIQAAKITIALLLLIGGALLVLLVLDVISFEDLKTTFGKVFLIALISLGVVSGLFALGGKKS